MSQQVEERIRTAGRDDAEGWLFLRQRLWPAATEEQQRAEIERQLRDPEHHGALLAARADGWLVGLVELSVRPRAKGCELSPVVYVEGWYVEPETRRRGLGRALLRAAEHWATQRGCQAMAADCRIDNRVGLLAHFGAGFEEVERVVLLRRSLGA